ncbi:MULTISPECIES: TcpQ domain-containing protein [unclassified Pseudomonas]|uniref:TcpQ domain-containing protein n=1 Tax=unclassified Pseudomonas TaxID=196821 RepID=UPI001FFEACDF|nr:TcpQ domain-containing protein [Pseudomonas sp. MWU12-2020]
MQTPGSTTAPSKSQSTTTTATKDFSVSSTHAPPPVVAPVTPAAKTPPPVATPKPAVPAPIPKPVWIASEGESLRKVITAWSQRAGYTLSWRAEDLDYGIEAPLRFEGSYEEAVASIFHLYDKADRSFIVDGRRPQHRLIVTEDLKKSKGATP